ncbi:MAG: hypothetical protein R2826_05170 [Thermoleophilia bacterium]
MSRRRSPELPPSSAIVTTAVRLLVRLEAAQQRRQTSVATDRDDPGTAGETRGGANLAGGVRRGLVEDPGAACAYHHHDEADNEAIGGQKKCRPATLL